MKKKMDLKTFYSNLNHKKVHSGDVSRQDSVKYVKNIIHTNIDVFKRLKDR